MARGLACAINAFRVGMGTVPKSSGAARTRRDGVRRFILSTMRCRCSSPTASASCSTSWGREERMLRKMSPSRRHTPTSIVHCTDTGRGTPDTPVSSPSTIPALMVRDEGCATASLSALTASTVGVCRDTTSSSPVPTKYTSHAGEPRRMRYVPATYASAFMAWVRRASASAGHFLNTAERRRRLGEGVQRVGRMASPTRRRCISRLHRAKHGDMTFCRARRALPALTASSRIDRLRAKAMRACHWATRRRLLHAVWATIHCTARHFATFDRRTPCKTVTTTTAAQAARRSSMVPPRPFPTPSSPQ
eukprot:Sspe_Gene.68492::Locus_40393_Transcript_1_2_Confidence_0.625_Length_2457::g.68492::m.68492